MKPLDRRGFTLLEILVALAILGVVVSAVYASFFSVSASAERLASAEETLQTGRALLEMLSRELRGLTYWQDPTTQEGFGLEGHPGAEADRRLDSIRLLTRNYIPSDADPAAGAMAEIGYFFDVDAASGTARLIRSEDPAVDLDFETGGRLLPLTDRIETFRVTYYDPKDQGWRDDWDAAARRGLPSWIRVEITLRDPSGGPVRLAALVQPAREY